MTPEAQRIAIAKVCGWAIVDSMGCKWKAPNGRVHENWSGALSCPNYLNDLNDIHKAEKTLGGGRQEAYYRALDEIVQKPQPSGRMIRFEFKAVHAAAAQRSEAFLRVLDLWVD